MFDHILLAVDMEHDESWKKALPAAIQNAKAFGAALHVMTVVPDFGRSLVSSFFPSGHEDQMMEKANEALHDFVKAHIPDDVAVQHIVGYGNAYEEILRVADEVKIDLIVIGAHRPKMEDYLIGPNAARVVRHAKCSVLVVRE
ncbi:universal stress protein [Curvivirga sp.]|uniref:universal stress protein n=1 Tax=Curvivirga sp. TaxID=2856848 RepID=UPI003B58DDD0